MNNRQKAKHFKMLYESMLPTKNRPMIAKSKRIVEVKASQTVHESVVSNWLSADERPPYVIAGDLLSMGIGKEVMNYSKCEIVPSILPEHVDLVATVEVVVGGR